MRSALFSPVGPYYLSGYCFGAIVAFDMAQRLLRAGEEVDLLAVFNGPSPSWIRRYGAIGGQPSRRTASPGPTRSLTARVIGVLTSWTKIRHWISHLSWRFGKRFIDPVRIRLAMTLDRPLSEEQREFFFLEIAGRAQLLYEASPYPGPMVVFHGEGVYEDPTLGWSHAVESVEAFAIPGPHRGNRSLMAEPAAGLLAGQMQGVLARARAQSPSRARCDTAGDRRRACRLRRNRSSDRSELSRSARAEAVSTICRPWRGQCSSPERGAVWAGRRRRSSPASGTT